MYGLKAHHRGWRWANGATADCFRFFRSLPKPTNKKGRSFRSGRNLVTGQKLQASDAASGSSCQFLFNLTLHPLGRQRQFRVTGLEQIGIKSAAMLDRAQGSS